MIHDIYLAECREDAEKAMQRFVSKYELKYSKAVDCLLKNKEDLFAFFNFPAEHWIHLRTTNPIESTFATVKHRTKKSKNCFSRNTVIAAVFKLSMEAEKRWRPLRGKHRIAQIIDMQRFIDGINENEINDQKLSDNDGEKYAA